MSTASEEHAQPDPTTAERVSSVDAWAAFNEHQCALPSGAEVLIRFPDLGDMILSDQLTERLQNAAARQMLKESDTAQQADARLAETVEQAKASVTPEDVERVAREQEERILSVARAGAELERYLVLSTVIDPVLTEADLVRLPPGDKEFLAQVAMREQETDALGRPLGVRLVAELVPFRSEPNRAARRARKPSAKKAAAGARTG